MGKLIKENVGKENAFRGIKLYPPNGYSPTDPHLFEKGNDFVEGQCLYEYCLNKNIPIMVHCSFEGFSTFVMNLEVWGDVYLNDKPTGEYILTTYNQPEEITFESNIFKGGFKKSVRERAHVLNHPCIWKKVLEEFPDLKICLAHFGGESDEWRNRIADLMREYSHVYTDLSCTVDKKVLEKIRDQYFSPSAPDPINDRIMYGSDYVLNMLSVKSFGDYYNHFYKASLFTGQQRENMMLHVPERFLS